MDIEHHNQKLQLDGALHICPLKDPKEALDLGTGRPSHFNVQDVCLIVG